MILWMSLVFMAGLMDGLQDQWRDYGIPWLASRNIPFISKYARRTTEMRSQWKIYQRGKFFWPVRVVCNLLVEYINDLWHSLKVLKFVTVIVIVPLILPDAFVWYHAVLALVIFGTGFLITYKVMPRLFAVKT